MTAGKDRLGRVIGPWRVPRFGPADSDRVNHRNPQGVPLADQACGPTEVPDPGARNGNADDGKGKEAPPRKRVGLRRLAAEDARAFDEGLAAAEEDVFFDFVRTDSEVPEPYRDLTADEFEDAYLELQEGSPRRLALRRALGRARGRLHGWASIIRDRALGLRQLARLISRVIQQIGVRGRVVTYLRYLIGLFWRTHEDGFDDSLEQTLVMWSDRLDRADGVASDWWGRAEKVYDWLNERFGESVVDGALLVNEARTNGMARYRSKATTKVAAERVKTTVEPPELMGPVSYYEAVEKEDEEGNVVERMKVTFTVSSTPFYQAEDVEINFEQMAAPPLRCDLGSWHDSLSDHLSNGATVVTDLIWNALYFDWLIRRAPDILAHDDDRPNALRRAWLVVHGNVGGNARDRALVMAGSPYFLDFGRNERPGGSGWRPGSACLCTELGHSRCTNVDALVFEAREVVAGQSPGVRGIHTGGVVNASLRHHVGIVDRWAERRFGRNPAHHGTLRAHVLSLARAGTMAIPTTSLMVEVADAADETALEAAAAVAVGSQLE